MKALDRSWINCLRMWKWITENLPEGFSESSNGTKQVIIKHRKAQWLRENKFTKSLLNDCFFCASSAPNHEKGCGKCPAKLVRKSFCCMEDGFHYALDPINFYHRVLKLSKRRRA